MCPPAAGGCSSRNGASAPFFVLEKLIMARTLAIRIEALLRPEIEALGYELIVAEYITGGAATLRLYVDSPQGITVDDCETISHQVSGVLDVENPLPGAYTLEVSSPGLDRPLVTTDHFARFVGEEVRLSLKRPRDGRRRRFRGAICAVEDDQILLRVDGQELRVGMQEIESARLVPQFK